MKLPTDKAYCADYVLQIKPPMCTPTFPPNFSSNTFRQAKHYKTF